MSIGAKQPGEKQSNREGLAGGSEQSERTGHELTSSVPKLCSSFATRAHCLLAPPFVEDVRGESKVAGVGRLRVRRGGGE